MTALGAEVESSHLPLFTRFRISLRHLYAGRSANSRLFLYALLVFDFTSLLFIIATSFLPRNDLVRGFDVAFGIALPNHFEFGKCQPLNSGCHTTPHSEAPNQRQ